MTTEDPKRAARQAKALDHAQFSIDAATRIVAAFEAGNLADLADAKILEAAGCYIRRNAAYDWNADAT